MLDGRDGKARQKAMELLLRYATQGAVRSVSSTREMWRACRLGQSIPAALLRRQGRRRPRRDLFLFRPRLRRARRGARRARPDVSPAGGADPRQWQTLGVKVEVFRNYQEREGFRRSARRHDTEDLHTARWQSAGEGRALRVDGIVRRHLCELRARRAHEHGRARKHQRGDADRQNPRLGTASRGTSLRHASHRRASCPSNR